MPGKENDSLRSDGTKWIATDFLSMTKYQTKINFGQGVPENTPNNTAVTAPVLIVNGNVQIKGKNYKSVGSQDERFFADGGDGIGEWKGFQKELGKTMIRIGYRFEEDNAYLQNTTNIGVFCPAEYPRALAGGGSCDNKVMSDSFPIMKSCVHGVNGHCEKTGWIAPNGGYLDVDYDYAGTNGVSQNQSGDVDLGKSDGWLINCNAVVRTAEVFATCSK